MARPADELPTFDELYARIERLPEGVTGEILEPGVVHTMSRPGRPHRRTAKLVSDSLAGIDLDRGGRGWILEIEAELRLPTGRLAVPDISGWKVDGDLVPAFLDVHPIEVVPDWVCEVLSPTTERTDRVLKLTIYASAGIEWIWLVDPVARFVEVYRTSDALPVRVLAAEENETRALPPFESVEINLARWWLPGASSSPAP